MSNKLKKFSLGYKETYEELKKRILETGGLNITPELMKEFTETDPDGKPITEDEFYSVLDNLQKDGFRLYKISQICKDKEIRGMMICSSDTVVAFAKQPKDEEKKEE